MGTNALKKKSLPRKFLPAYLCTVQGPAKLIYDALERSFVGAPEIN
jgi:hypothetical protein